MHCYIAYFGSSLHYHAAIQMDNEQFEQMCRAVQAISNSNDATTRKVEEDLEWWSGIAEHILTSRVVTVSLGLQAADDVNSIAINLTGEAGTLTLELESRVGDDLVARMIGKEATDPFHVVICVFNNHRDSRTRIVEVWMLLRVANLHHWTLTQSKRCKYGDWNWA